MKIEITTPQFKRPWELVNNYIPKNEEDFIEAVSFAPIKVLTDMGFCQWDDENKAGKILYLFPGEWYNVIPDKYPIVSISGKKELFIKGKSDNDIRFGCLPYGILK